MKILILYSTHGGASKKCAEMLEKKLNDRCEVTLCNARETDELPLSDEYEVVVIGGPIRFGRIDKALRNYLKSNAEKISEKSSAFFFCCGFPSELEDYVDTQLPKSINFSLGVHCFGGELKPENMKGMDKLVVKMVRSHIKSQDFEESEDKHIPLPELLPESIQRLADIINKL